MTLVQLRHFLALAESGSFRATAEAVFLTQPALSRSIASLEDELGQSLFDRMGRRSELTPFGRSVLERARRIVAEADELKAIGQRMQQGLTGEARIGLGSGPAALLMTPLLRQIAQDHPGVRVEIARGATSRLEQSLRDRELDALVIDARSLRPSPDLRVETLAEMRGAFMCRPGHPLADVGRTVRFEEMLTYPIASTPLSDEVSRALVERFGPRAHPETFVTLRCSEIPHMIEAARVSDTIVLAIRAAAPDLLELRLTPAMTATARFGLVTLAARSESPVMPLIRELIERLLHD